MAELLGVGLTHSPSLISPDEDGNTSLARTLRNNDRIPAELKDPRNWPEAMRLEWSDDQGLASAKAQRERLVRGFRRAPEATFGANRWKRYSNTGDTNRQPGSWLLA